ncbi:MFS transporter [Maribius pontilimi]|uniref:MFS transporter n=1 Tax=Palleronia pontilimi TaxID=1964209 RepID=A0A934I8B1_9RHOB|nr:MFS transporter [Palleronia pontilimi]MBJ3762128.1 MFS transporter [Palleronia pontilimi]
MRLMISFAALFASVILLQLGSGGIAPLDAISGLGAGFTAAEVGLLGSAHFAGFMLGCWWCPRLMGSIGHSRSFAAFTALGVIGILAHVLVENAYAWAVFRVMSGLCIAGSYTVVEAWLQAKVTNETRGRTTGIYRIVDIVGSLGAQLLIGVLTPGAYVSYALLAIFCCAALLPLTLTRLPQPPVAGAPRLRPRLAWDRSPLGAVGVVVAGLTAAAFRMVGPIYGVEVGLSADLIALFLAAFVLGGALSEYPAGWLADRFDRRHVLIGISAAGIAASAATVALAQGGVAAVMLGAGLFGLATFPIYSISLAHAHDYATDDERVELSAALMFLYACGAVVSPYLVSVLIGAFGPAAMFVFVSLVHIGLIVWGVARMRDRPAATRTAFVATPRTSFTIGRLIRRRRR